MFEKLGYNLKLPIERFLESGFFKKGAYLFEQEEVCKRIFLVKRGVCRKFLLHEGKEITTDFVFPGSFLCSAKSFVMSHPAGEFAQALTDVETFSITKTDFESIKQQDPDLQAIDLQFVELYAVSLEERVLAFQTQDATTRYLNLANNHPEMLQTIPLTHIASYLGVSLETLSRIRAKIAKGII